MSQIYGSKIEAGETLTVESRQGYSFVLVNVALDPHSEQALLYTEIGGKQILIASLNKQKYRVVSININLEFQPGVETKLSSQLGVVHVIGNFKTTRAQVETQSPSEAQGEPQPQPAPAVLRRSKRQRKPVSAPPQKGDHTLINMAKYYHLNEKQMQEEESEGDEVYVHKELKEGGESSSSSLEQGQPCDKKQNGETQVQSEANSENQTICENSSRKRRKTDGDLHPKQFAKPTKNPFD